MKLEDFNTKEYYMELKDTINLYSDSIRDFKKQKKTIQKSTVNITSPTISGIDKVLNNIRYDLKQKLQLRALMKAYRKEILKECSDLNWYVTNIALEIGLNLEIVNKFRKKYIDQRNTFIDYNYICIQQGKLCEIVKKIFRDKNNICDADDVLKIEKILRICFLI